MVFDKGLSQRPDRPNSLSRMGGKSFPDKPMASFALCQETFQLAVPQRTCPGCGSEGAGG